MTMLSMLSIQVSLRHLRQLSMVQGLDGDEGRMLHHALSEAFGKSVVQPFRLLPGRGNSTQATLYAYTLADREQLLQTARELAPPDLLALFNVETLQTKPMPESWAVGRRLAFDVMLRPVRRLLKLMPAHPTPYRKGAEIDAFLVHLGRSELPAPSGSSEALPLREEVYRQWLQERLSGASLDVERTRMVRFSCAPSLRHRHSGNAPDAVFHGELTITDSTVFQQQLARGIGRHTAYGFGMLLLRPARG